MAKRTLEQQRADLDAKIARKKAHEQARDLVAALKTCLHGRNYADMVHLSETLVAAAKRLNGAAVPVDEAAT